MFEASLFESTGQIRTRSGRFAAASFFLQAAALFVFALFPILHPASLEKHEIRSILAPPSAPVAPHSQKTSAATSSPTRAMLSFLQNTRQIIRPDAQTAAAGQEDPAVDPGFDPGVVNIGGATPADQVLGAMPGPSSTRPIVRQEAPTKAGPVRVSSGVASGQLLAPIRPQYPAIARQARVQGTVVVHALISKSGQVENAQVVSGSPLLAQAAVSAVAQARYRPYLLNGEPVEVETTVNVIFQLNE